MTQNDEVESEDPLADSEYNENVKSKRAKSPAKGNGTGTSLGVKTPTVQYGGCIVMNSESESEEQIPHG